jgi:hypothetical protein
LGLSIGCGCLGGLWKTNPEMLGWGLVENKLVVAGAGISSCRLIFCFFFLKKKKRKKKRREKKCYQTKLPIVNELGLVDERGYYLHQMQLIK